MPSVRGCRGRFPGVNAKKSACASPSYPQTEGKNKMERVTLRIPKQQIEEVERMVDLFDLLLRDP